MKLSLLKLGNHLYERAYLLYRPLYGAYKGISDRCERKVLRERLRSGMTVVDVGANIGSYTRFLAKLVGKKGRVIAFEPESRNFERLLANIAKFEHVSAVHAAVSDHVGDIELFLSDQLNVDHRTYGTGETRRRVKVPAVSLDGFFEKGTPIDVIKIDVQGYEYQVLRGAQRILQENDNIVVLIEFWPYGLQKAGTAPNSLLEFIASLGFSWCPTPVPSNASFSLALLDSRREDHYCNLLLTKSVGSAQSKSV